VESLTRGGQTQTNKANKQTKSHTPDAQVCKLQATVLTTTKRCTRLEVSQKKRKSSKEEEKASLNSIAFFPSIDTSTTKQRSRRRTRAP
jgi:hypothetical protein